MDKTTFWAIRLTIVSVAGILALAAIIIILKHKLQQRLPMQYTLIIAVCHLIMIIFSVVFGICSMVGSPAFGSDNTFESQTLKVLCQIQATLFKSAELISFAIASALLLLIYSALNFKIIEFERKLKVACFVVPIVLMVVMGGLQANGVCSAFSNAFNCVCLRTEIPLGYYLGWILPCGLLTLLNIFAIYKIAQKRKQAQLKKILRFEHKLVLIIYSLPFVNFIIYSIYLIMVIINQQLKLGSEIMMGFQHLIYFMPLVNLLVVLQYNRNYQMYINGRPEEFETMIHEVAASEEESSSEGQRY